MDRAKVLTHIRVHRNAEEKSNYCVHEMWIFAFPYCLCRNFSLYEQISISSTMKFQPFASPFKPAHATNQSGRLEVPAF
jgi:hypothetical protein